MIDKEERSLDPIFTSEQWKTTAENWANFWEGRLERPLVTIEAESTIESETQRFKKYFPQYPEQMSIDEIVAVEIEHIKSVSFLGDAFPRRFFNFGAGSIASYLGSKVECEGDTVWFRPLNKELKDIDINIDHDNPWYNRVKDMQEALLEAFGGEALVSFSDLGGNLDILASLRGTERLLYDLYDNPSEVDKKSRALTEVWIDCYLEEAARFRRANQGYTIWAPFYCADKTMYLLQSDFSYMISPKMFERFVIPDLERCCEVMDIPFYHLDGKGQLPHLDLVLSLEDLQGVQWVPGEGQPEANEWPEVLSRIRDSGKFVQIALSLKGALDLKKKIPLDGFIIDVAIPEGMTREEIEAAYEELFSKDKDQ